MKKFILPLLMLSLACVRQVQESQPIAPKFKKVMEKVPPKEISAFDKLSFDFLEDVPEAKLRAEVNPQKIFQFIPPLYGRCWWERKDLLVFAPFTPLKANQRYTCKLKLSALSQKFKDYPPLEVSFQIHHNEILDFQGRFQRDKSLKSDSDQIFRATFKMTNLSYTKEKVEKGVKVTLNHKSLDFTFSKEKGLYHIQAPFKTPKKGGKLEVVFNKDILGLPKETSYSFPLAPVSNFRADKLKLQWEEGKPKVHLTFSHPLKEDQPIDSFIRIKPNLELKYAPQGNILKISGDFQHGVKYHLTVVHGLKNFKGEKIRQDQNFFFTLSEIPPELILQEDKIWLSSKGAKKLRIKTVNIKSLRVSVFFIPIQNVVFALQRFERPHYYGEDQLDVERTGKQIYSHKINIKAELNQWIEQDLALAIPYHLSDLGIFLVKFRFDRHDTLLECKGRTDLAGGYWSYDDPCFYSYYYKKGNKKALVVISDIGLLSLKEGDHWNLWAYNVLTAKPEKDVEIEAYEFQNILVGKRTTNEEGYARFDKENIAFFIAKKGKNLSFIRTKAPSPPLEPFALEGTTAPSKGMQAFVYTERGVYRPSDDIHLVSIVRYGRTTPVTLPLKCVFKNPLNQVVQKKIEKSQKNGVYYFKLKTDIDAPTGIWHANLYAGENLLTSHPIRVEMVVPPKIKPEITLKKDKVYVQELPFPIQFSAKYLFGAPAANLPCQLKVRLSDTEVTFPKYPGFIFSTSQKNFVKEKVLFKGALNEEGKGHASFAMEKEEEVPNFLKADLTLEVTEKGGRPAYDRKSFIFYPHNYYIGAKYDPDRLYAPDQTVSIPYIVVDNQGKPIAGKELIANIYFSSYYWWWEVRDIKKVISSYYTELVRSTVVKSQKTPGILEVPLEESYGSYIVELRDKEENVGIFFTLPIRYWGMDVRKRIGGSYLKYEGVKENYHVGESLEVQVATPPEGTVFYAVAQGDRILSWDMMASSGTTTSVKIKVTKEMIPSAYLFISAIQKLTRKNDMPLRAYTIIPFTVVPDDGKLEMEIICPDEVKPKASFPVTIKLLNQDEGVVTLAVVDEGLLQLTQEKTPDPFSFFYRKIAWNLQYQDSFDDFYELPGIPAQYTYYVGGGTAAKKRLVSPVKSNPFPPVVFFKGPIHIKKQKTMDVVLPNYMGAVRVMVVGTFNQAYGSFEKSVKVVDDVIPFATMPRAVAPSDKFEIPLQLFIQKSQKGEIRVEISSSKHFQLLGKRTFHVPFQAGERMLYFHAKAKEDTIGEGFIKIILRAKKNYEILQKIPIHPINSYTSKSYSHTLMPMEEKAIEVPVLGFPEIASTTLTLSRDKIIPLASLYDRVVNYPFGCIEQTSSKLFATLFLRDLVSIYGDIFPYLNQSTLDNILEKGFRKLQYFARPSGNFSFWPGSYHAASDWTNVYVAHLLIEANKRGFALQGFVDKVVDYHKRKAKEKILDLYVQAYRLFILALNETPDLSSMNLLRENYLSRMGVDEKLMLSASYAMIKDHETAMDILQGIEGFAQTLKEHEYYYNISGPLGTRLYFLSWVDQGLAFELFNLLGEKISPRHWWSTHDIGWFCAGYVSFLKAFGGRAQKIQCLITFPDKRKNKVKKDTAFYTMDLHHYFGKTIKIKNLSQKPLYLEFTTTGIPMEVPTEKEFSNVTLETTFLDENGEPIDPHRMKAGTVIYEKITMNMTLPQNYMAITQIFPAGWEPINLRLLNQELPTWAKDASKPSYMDIRDDRVNIFVDYPTYRSTYIFYVPLKAVTKGYFVFSPTIAQGMYNPKFFAQLPQGYVQVE